MQRSLIDIDPADDGLAMLDIDDGKAVKPLVPLLAEMSLDANEIVFLCHACVVLFLYLNGVIRGPVYESHNTTCFAFMTPRLLFLPCAMITAPSCNFCT